MRFNPLSMRDLAAADKAPPSASGLTLIKTVQLFNAGGGGSTGNFYPQIVVDVPEAPFGKFRRILFQFTAIGLVNSTTAQLQMIPRKNGGQIQATTYYQVIAATGAATNYFASSNVTIGSGALVSNNVLTNAQSIRTFEVWMDAYGYDTYLAIGSGNATLSTSAMTMGTGTYAQDGTRQLFGPTDYCGMQLQLSSANYFTNPSISAVNTPAQVYCDIYGWTMK